MSIDKIMTSVYIFGYIIGVVFWVRYELLALAVLSFIIAGVAYAIRHLD